jgi:hypothetical protein
MQSCMISPDRLLGIPLSIRILFSNKEEDFVELKTYVRDTILLAPEGKKSLAEVGKLVGFEKIKLADRQLIDGLRSRPLRKDNAGRSNLKTLVRH